MSVLVIAEHDNQSVKAATLNTVTAATLVANDVVVLVAGHNCGGAIEAAKNIAGAKNDIWKVNDDADYLEETEQK